MIVVLYSAGRGGANRKSPMAIVSDAVGEGHTRLGKRDIEVLIQVGSRIDDPGDLDRLIRTADRHFGSSHWESSVLSLKDRTGYGGGEE